MESLQVSCFLTGTFWDTPVKLLLSSPKKARAYPFPQSVKIHYFCSGPISSADPICPFPNCRYPPGIVFIGSYVALYYYYYCYYCYYYYYYCYYY